MRLPERPTKRVRVCGPQVRLSAPVVHAGKIVAGRYELACFDEATVEEVWRRSVPWVRVDAGVSGVLLLNVPSQRATGSGQFAYQGISLEDGSVLWTLEPDEGTTDCRRFGTRLYRNNPGICGFDCATGEMVEHHAFDEPFYLGWPMDSTLYIYATAAERDVIRLYDRARGTEVWSKNLRSEMSRLIGSEVEYAGLLPGSAWGEILLARGGTYLFGIDRQSGEIRWHQSFDVSGATFAFEQGAVHACVRSDGGRGYAFLRVDQATGEVIFRRALREYAEPVASAQDPTLPSVHRDFIAFGSGSGVLMVFRRSDGELVWSHQRKAELYEPVLLENRLLCCASDGSLLVFDGAA